MRNQFLEVVIEKFQDDYKKSSKPEKTAIICFNG